MSTLNGLPARVLLVHAVVVLLPLAALLLVLTSPSRWSPWPWWCGGGAASRTRWRTPGTATAQRAQPRWEQRLSTTPLPGSPRGG